MAESCNTIKPVRHPQCVRHDDEEDERMPMQHICSSVAQQLGSSVAHQLLMFYGVSAAGVVIQERGSLCLAVAEGLPLPGGQSRVEIDETSVLHDTLARRMPTVIADASRDRRYEQDPLVEQPLGLRFIVRAPLLTKDSMRVGTLFLADQEPRESFCVLRDGKELMDAATRISEMLAEEHAAPEDASA